ncbi:MAG: adenylate kinase family protein [Candidatus Aenigmatarchaeota archaeon]
MYKIISISGTPGVGKTEVAKQLARLLGANLISINKLIKKGKVPYKLDKKRKTKIIDIKILQKVINKEIKKGKINIIEGHLSHLLKSDKIIILRANPQILEKRMKKKKWSKNKIEENIKAEILDMITIETLEKHNKNKIIEIDTTNKKPKVISMTIMKILNNHRLQKEYSIGKIDWTKKYFKELVK